MKILKLVIVGVAMISVSCSGGSSADPDESALLVEVDTSVTTPKKSIDDLIYKWSWEPARSLDTFRKFQIPTIETSLLNRKEEASEVPFSAKQDPRFCIDLFSLADFAADDDGIQPKILLSQVLVNSSAEVPRVPGKIFSIVEFVVLSEGFGGAGQITKNYDQFLGRHELPCKGKMPGLIDAEFDELKLCETHLVPGYDTDCLEGLKLPLQIDVETSFNYSSNFQTLSGEVPAISAIAVLNYKKIIKIVRIETLVYVPVMSRAVLLTVKLYDQENILSEIELLEQCTDLSIAVWSDIQGDLLAFLSVSGY